MTYSTRQYKSGRKVGYIHFDSGKKVYLNPEELKDFQAKINHWNYQAVEQYKLTKN